MILEQWCSVTVSALVVCAVVLQMNNLGSFPTVHNFSTSLAVVSLMGKLFFPAQTKPSTLARRNTRAGNQEFGLERK